MFCPVPHAKQTGFVAAECSMRRGRRAAHDALDHTDDAGAGVRLADQDGSWNEAMLCRRVAGCVNHREIRVRCATTFCYIPAVDLPWQSDVGEEHVRIVLVIPSEGRFPTLRLDDIESRVEKLSNDQFADKPFVFDNEDLHGLTPFTEVSLASHS